MKNRQDVAKTREASSSIKNKSKKLQLKCSGAPWSWKRCKRVRDSLGETAIMVKGITWVLVYRTDKYKRLKAEVEKQSKKLEKKKETITESAGRQQKKKIERQEEKLKNNNRDLSMVRMKSMFAIGFCFTALMGMFNSIFDGRVVAKLPFIPLSYIQGLSHRNLLGEDCTDCSFIFLYILCTMSIRQNIQKLLGLAPSRAATKQAGGFLGPPPQAGKFS
uniref:Calcium load-activated calcium channel n=1 Tax=Naja naja TaxID=35670 RepID=A0A8C6VJP8_NAJNA